MTVILQAKTRKCIKYNMSDYSSNILHHICMTISTILMIRIYLSVTVLNVKTENKLPILTNSLRTNTKIFSALHYVSPFCFSMVENTRIIKSCINPTNNYPVLTSNTI